jgi:hypothetical protein
MSRSFTIEKSDIGETGGRFMGDAPYRVASKAARSLFKYASEHRMKVHELRFTIRETTEGSAKKTFTYIGMKKSLHKPIIVKRGDVEIKIHHTYHVKSCHA